MKKTQGKAKVSREPSCAKSKKGTQFQTPLTTARRQDNKAVVSKRKVQSLRSSPLLFVKLQRPQKRSSAGKQTTAVLRSLRQSAGHAQQKYKQKKQKQKKTAKKKGEGLSGQLLWSQGQVLKQRYQLLEHINRGTFGEVVRAFDRTQQCFVAVKLVRKQKKVTEQAKRQAAILSFVNALQKERGQRRAVQLKDTFEHRGHLCLVQQLLGINLFQVLQETRGGLPLDELRQVGQQMLKCLAFMEEAGLIHGDIKPENVLLQRGYSLRLVDFGSSCKEGQVSYNYIQSRYYRAPEVILGLPITHLIDVWSFGCVLAELYLGRPLLPGYSEVDQFHKIVELIGLPSQKIINQAARKEVFFKGGELRGGGRRAKGVAQVVGESGLAELLSHVLVYELEERWPASRLLRHEWLSDQ